MNQKIKIGLYAVLGITVLTFGILFYSSYRRVSHPETATNASPSQVTNETTNSFPAIPAVTNEVDAANTNETVSIEPATNEVAPRAVTNAPVTPNIPTASTMTAGTSTPGRSAMIGYLVAFFLFAILLGLLIAFDISQFFGNRSVEFLFNDEGEVMKTPEYEEAEQEWNKGHHLEAIRMMREYLNRNPREQYVALRIAEIYEKDLKNFLAAALEYEDVLKHKLPDQRWGWAAIHLCNLYSKLGKTDQAVALLHRIVNEYGATPAAEKARKRLAMFESAGEAALQDELPDTVQMPPPQRVIPEENDPSSKLPPGFRPKK
ncbi:MAG: hypothetical protein ABJC04_05725 [Verrucomicrobiota bacterium]